jgi:hypothetical protein
MFAFASLAVLALAIGVRADLVISTPSSATQCQPVTFQISGSTSGPYYAFVVDASNPCGDALAEIDNIQGTSFTWSPTVAAGETVAIALEANDGTEAWSGSFTVGAGDSSCITTSASASSTSTGTTSTPAVAAALTHTTPSTTHTTGTAPPVNAASNAPLDNSTHSGASRAVVGFSGMAALIGAAVVAFSL